MEKRSVFWRCEIFVYFSVYIVYIVIGLWKIYALRERILDVSQFEFAQGWRLLSRPQDDSNDELENFTNFIRSNWYWYLLHAVVSTITRLKFHRWRCHGYTLVCVVALLCSLQWLSLTLFGALLVSFYFVVNEWKSKKGLWMLAGLWMVFINGFKNNRYCYETLGYTEYVTLIIVMAWTLLRCCSYGLTFMNDISEERSERYSLAQFLGYTLYFPYLAYGPFMTYKRFLGTQETVDFEWRLKRFIWELLRVCGWWLFMQFALHFFYIHYMARDVEAVKLIGSVFWQHAAGYFMGQFFFLYYVITYGLGIAFARFDGIDAPQRPRCIGRIHFYSDMWKYFDEGLYEFLFQHIYAELCGKNSSPRTKIFATAVTFSFVFVWHGCYTYVLIWSVLNFVCLAAEKCFKTLSSSPANMGWMLQHFGPHGTQRLYALLATQLFIPAAFSNVYFISGKEVGDFLMKGAYLSGFGNYFALCFCSYCFFQCSEVLLNKTQFKIINKKTL